jgi:DNA invertase Pin-like site-specific DNA recombinase
MIAVSACKKLDINTIQINHYEREQKKERENQGRIGAIRHGKYGKSRRNCFFSTNGTIG